MVLQYLYMGKQFSQNLCSKTQIFGLTYSPTLLSIIYGIANIFDIWYSICESFYQTVDWQLDSWDASHHTTYAN